MASNGSMEDFGGRLANVEQLLQENVVNSTQYHQKYDNIHQRMLDISQRVDGTLAEIYSRIGGLEDQVQEIAQNLHKNPQLLGISGAGVNNSQNEQFLHRIVGLERQMQEVVHEVRKSPQLLGISGAGADSLQNGPILQKIVVLEQEILQ